MERAMRKSLAAAQVRGCLQPALRPHRRAEERDLPPKGTGEGLGDGQVPRGRQNRRRPQVVARSRDMALSIGEHRASS